MAMRRCWASCARTRSTESPDPPPGLASAFEPLAPAARPSQAPERDPHSAYDIDDQEAESAAEVAPAEDDYDYEVEPDVKPEPKTKPVTNSGPPKPKVVARSQQHRIVDGDTLASLAQQYLGDANRWQVIYDANRTALTSTEWLPVGITITIPAADSGA